MVIIDHISIWRCRKYPMESPSVYCERNDIKEAFNIASMCCTGCAMQCYKAFYYISKCVCECMEWLGTVSKRCAFSSIFLFAFIFCAHFFWTFCCTRRKKWIQLITFAECVTCHITVLAKYVFSIETIFNFVYSLHSWPQQNLCEHDNNLLANLLISYAYECHAQGFADVTRDSEKLPSFITHTKFNNRYECRLLIIMYTARSCVYILYINMYVCSALRVSQRCLKIWIFSTWSLYIHTTCTYLQTFLFSLNFLMNSKTLWFHSTLLRAANNIPHLVFASQTMWLRLNLLVFITPHSN